MTEVERYKTYIRNLDDKVQGGIPVGQSVVIWGPAGTLKSSIAFSVAFRHALEGRRAVYFCLEQNSATLIRQMRQMGMDVDKVREKMTVIDMGFLRSIIERDEAAAHPSQFEPRIKFFDWGSAVLTHLSHLNSEAKVDICVVDSLNVLTTFMHQDEIRARLFNFMRNLLDLRTTAILIAEGPCSDANGEGTDVVKYMADGLVFVDIEKHGRTTTRLLQVVKLRSTDHPTDMYPLLFDGGYFKVLTT